MQTRLIATWSVAAALTLGAAGCGSGGSDGSEGTGGATTSDAPTTTEARATSTTEATTTTDGADRSSREIVGTWTADAGDILSANTANVGGAGGLTCEGPITMTFTDEGTFSRAGNVSCTGPGGLSGSGTIATTGEWFFDADTGGLVISGTVADGVLTLQGREVPFPDSFGDGQAEYSVDGDQLEITFTIDPVGTVTQTYARA